MNLDGTPTKKKVKWLVGTWVSNLSLMQGLIALKLNNSHTKLNDNTSASTVLTPTDLQVIVPKVFPSTIGRITPQMNFQAFAQSAISFKFNKKDQS